MSDLALFSTSQQSAARKQPQLHFDGGELVKASITHSLHLPTFVGKTKIMYGQDKRALRFI